MTIKQTKEEKEAIKAAKLAEKEAEKQAKKEAKNVQKGDVVEDVVEEAAPTKVITFRGLVVSTPIDRVKHNGHEYLKFRTSNGQRFMIGVNEEDLLIQG